MFKGTQDKFEIYEKSHIFKRIKRGGFTLRPLEDTVFFLRQSNLKDHEIILMHKLNKPIRRRHPALFLVISS